MSEHTQERNKLSTFRRKKSFRQEKEKDEN